MSKFCYTKTIKRKRPSTGTSAAVAYKDNYWPLGTVLRVFFIDATLYQRVSFERVENEILEPINLFAEYVTDRENSDIRISFNEGWGSYSYVGTDNLFISKDQETMNIGWEGDDVMRHEFCHALGMLHEHQNPKNPIKWNEKVVIQALSGPPNYWSIEQIRFNVLDVLDIALVDATDSDVNSIMKYFAPPGWTQDGVYHAPNTQLSDTDRSFLSEKYPLPESNGHLDFCRSIWRDKSQLRRLLEVQLVRLAKSLGVDASVNDLKNDTVDRVWEKLRK